MTSTTKVYLAFDERMGLHRPARATEDPEDACFVHERPSRMYAVYSALQELEDRLITEALINGTATCACAGIADVEAFEEQEPGNFEPEFLADADLQNEHPSGRFIPLQCYPASKETIMLCHSEKHYDFLQHTSQLSDRALRHLTNDMEDLYFSRDTFAAACLAVGGCIECVNAVTDPDAVTTRAMAIVRPPGHHAVRDSAMGKFYFFRMLYRTYALEENAILYLFLTLFLPSSGFCYFNNIAIAAKHAIQTQRASRVFILDWDVHHGNGIQDLTYDDPNIFYLSIHRTTNKKKGYYFYPGTGKPDETGRDSGAGTNLNIALKEGGMGNVEYAAAFSELVLPVLASFEPDLVLIACGADAAKGDLLGDCGLTPEMYYIMTKSVLETAGVNVPFVTVLEGGYNLSVLAECLQAVNLAMLDEPYRASPDEEGEDVVDGRFGISRYWTRAKMFLIDESHATGKTSDSVTVKAVAAIRRSARALAYSQSRLAAFDCIQRPIGFVCQRDCCQKRSFRRLRMLDTDRYPQITQIKKNRRTIVSPAPPSEYCESAETGLDAEAKAVCI